MRLLVSLVMFVSLFSINLFAADYEVAIMPPSPIVIKTQARLDNRILLGPWFKVVIRITNNLDIPITLCEANFKVTSASGTTKNIQQTFNMSFCLVVPSHAIVGETMYVDGLPDDEGFIYDVQMRIEGWIGDLNEPISRAEMMLNFRTQ